MLMSLWPPGRNNGKKIMAVRIMKHTMEIIHLTTGENPIQVPFLTFGTLLPAMPPCTVSAVFRLR